MMQVWVNRRAHNPEPRSLIGPCHMFSQASVAADEHEGVDAVGRVQQATAQMHPSVNPRTWLKIVSGSQTKMVRRLSKKMVPKWSQHGPKNAPKLSENGPKMGPKLSGTALGGPSRHSAPTVRKDVGSKNEKRNTGS